MRVKFIISNEIVDLSVDHWCDIPIIPQLKGDVSIIDFLREENLNELMNEPGNWQGETGEVVHCILHKDDKGFYYQIWLVCN